MLSIWVGACTAAVRFGPRAGSPGGWWFGDHARIVGGRDGRALKGQNKRQFFHMCPPAVPILSGMAKTRSAAVCQRLVTAPVR